MTEDKLSILDASRNNPLNHPTIFLFPRLPTTPVQLRTLSIQHTGRVRIHILNEQVLERLNVGADALGPGAAVIRDAV